MANEATVSVSLRFQKNAIDVSATKTGLSISVSGDNYTKIVQNIGTSEEALIFGDVAVPGLCVIKNLDATNYVEIRPATGVADLMRINPGEVCLFRFAADCTAPFAIANTGAVQIETLLIET